MTQLDKDLLGTKDLNASPWLNLQALEDVLQDTRCHPSPQHLELRLQLMGAGRLLGEAQMLVADGVRRHGS